MNDSTLHSIVLIGRYPGKDVAVAQALAQCLGREETWGLRVVSACPIILLEKLSRQEALHVANLLKPVADSGCRFDVQRGADNTLPKVGWVAPAKIHGVPLADVCAEAAALPPIPTPPEALAPSSLPRDQAASRGTAKIALPFFATPAAQYPTPTQAQTPVQAAQTYTTVYLPCPYTGQTLKLTLEISISRMEAGGIGITANAQQAPPLPGRPTNSGTIVLPTARRGSITTALPASQDGGYARHSPTANVPVASPNVRGNSGANTLPSPSWKRRTPPENALPDVPVLPASHLDTDHAYSGGSPEPLPRDGQPMDLSDFEESLGVSPRPPQRPFVDAGPNLMGDPTSTSELDALMATAESEDMVCSIYIERSSSPVVHQLVAELHGIPESEAAQMCVAGRIALAESIPLAEAVDIKQRCASMNVLARIVTHR